MRLQPWFLTSGLRPGAVCFLFQMDTEIQAFFQGVDSLCRKYAQETAQVSGVPGPAVSAQIRSLVFVFLGSQSVLK